MVSESCSLFRCQETLNGKLVAGRRWSSVKLIADSFLLVAVSRTVPGVLCGDSGLVNKEFCCSLVGANCCNATLGNVFGRPYVLATSAATTTVNYTNGTSTATAINMAPSKLNELLCITIDSAKNFGRAMSCFIRHLLPESGAAEQTVQRRPRRRQPHAIKACKVPATKPPKAIMYAETPKAV